MRLTLLTLVAAFGSVPALAANQVALDNSVFVERVSTDAAGKRTILLEEPKLVVPGDRLVFVLNYRNASAQPADRFVITNPMPAAVQFQDGADSDAQYSVDSGRNWGRIDALWVKMTDGNTRPARPEDVTHIRWAFSNPIPAGGSGKLMFRGIVK